MSEVIKTGEGADLSSKEEKVVSRSSAGVLLSEVCHVEGTISRWVRGRLETGDGPDRPRPLGETD